jgi:hypothetical protein
MITCNYYLSNRAFTKMYHENHIHIKKTLTIQGTYHEETLVHEESTINKMRSIKNESNYDNNPPSNDNRDDQEGKEKCPRLSGSICMQEACPELGESVASTKQKVGVQMVWSST